MSVQPSGGLSAADILSNPALLSQYQQSAAGSGSLYVGAGAAAETKIPVWRDAAPKVNLKGKGYFDSPGAFSNASAKADASANPKQYTADEAAAQWGSILADKKKLDEWRQTAIETGLLRPDQANDAIQLGQAWKTAIDWAISIKGSTGQDLTPIEASKLVAENTGSGILAQQQWAKDHFTGDRTTTSSSTDLTADPNMAQSLQQLLGRNPSAKELAAYQHGLEAAAAAHPVNTTTTSHYVDGQQTSQAQVATGGFDKSAEFAQLAAADPEVAANQQATTYYSALVSALGAAV